MPTTSPWGAGRLRVFALLLLLPVLLALGLPEHTTLTPTFRVGKDRPRSAGRAFVVDHAGEELIVTALHLIGPLGGQPRQLTGEELPGQVSLELRGALSGKKLLTTEQVQPIPGAYPIEETGGILDVAGDIAVFEVPEGKGGRSAWKKPVNVLSVAEGCPAVGTKIWLASPLMGSPAATHAGTVTLCDGRRLEWRFEYDRNPRGMSGGPVLNAEGEVVAMALGAYTLRSDGGAERLVAVGMAAPTLSAHLSGEPVPRQADVVVDTPAFGEAPTWDNPWGIDLETLHTKQLTEWGVSGDGEEAIRRELSKHPELLATFDEISRLSWADNIGNFKEINGLIERWSALYAEAGLPLRLQAMAVGQQLGLLTTRVLHTSNVGEGRVEIHRRLDPLNVRDHPMEWHGDLVGLTYVNVARDGAVELILPLLAKDGGRAAAVRAEVDAALGAEVLGTLRGLGAVDPLDEALDPAAREALDRLTAMVAGAWLRGVRAGLLAEGEAATAGWLGLVTGPHKEVDAVLLCHAAAKAVDAKALAKELGGCEADLSVKAGPRLDALIGTTDLTIGRLPETLPSGLPRARK